MNHFLRMFAILCVFAGLAGRGFAKDPCESEMAKHRAEHAGHHHPADQPCDPSHDHDCPLGHQHGGTCCLHGQPLAGGEHEFSSIVGLLFSLAPAHGESDSVPDDPFLERIEPPFV